MDENAFKKTYSEFNERPCAFAKAVLTRCCGCSRSQKVLIAEREAIACHSGSGYERCSEVLQRMREKALFALRLTQLDGRLPHGKEIKVQCGTALGLKQALEPDGDPKVEDIHRLLDRVGERWPDAEAIPYAEVVKAIGAYKARKRSA